MKHIILFAIAFCIGTAAFAQEPACPVVTVSTSSESTPAGQDVSYTANVSGGGGDYTYNWSISAGSITSGQGTSSITVDSKGMANSSITATLEVGGMSRSCSNTSSATASISEEAKPIKPVKVKAKAKPGKTKAKS
jgi:hypothetical protein